MEQCTTMFNCLVAAFSWIDAIDLDWFISVSKFLFVLGPAIIAFAFVGIKLANILPHYPDSIIKDLVSFSTCIGAACLAAYLVGLISYCAVIVFMGGF